MLDEEFSFPTFMGDKIRLRVVRVGSNDRSLEQRARAQVAARELRLGVEWHSAPILLVVQQLSEVLRGRDPFFLPRSSNPDIHDRAFFEDLVETVERALETGRLLVVEGAFPLLAPPPELELTEREPPPLEQPPLPPIARPARPDRLTFFEVRVVDEIGQAIGGLEVELKAGDAVETISTNPAGIATLEDVTSMAGSVSVVDIEALRVIVGIRSVEPVLEG